MNAVTFNEFAELTQDDVEQVDGGVFPLLAVVAVMEGAAIGATLYAAVWTICQ